MVIAGLRNAALGEIIWFRFPMLSTNPKWAMFNITLAPLSTSTRALVITDWTRQQTEQTTNR